jgi:hypothetical protein
MEQFPREVLCDWKLSRSTFSVAVRRVPSALTLISTLASPPFRGLGMCRETLTRKDLIRSESR